MSRGILYGSYFLVGRLNRGGMAEVFLGKRVGTSAPDTLLAVKRMRTELAGDTTFVKMFLDEARIAGRLQHANICRLYEQGQHGDEVYLAMEFIHGKDLRAVARRAAQRGERIPARVVALVLLRIAEALHYAHTRETRPGEPEGIVHRDVSPQNILIGYDGIPKLIDFGIAKAKDRLARTQVGVLKGKFAYMAPEQATGASVDARTDIFSLGVVLYEMLAGALPFRGASDFSTLQHIARCQYRPPQELAPETPRDLARIVQRALVRSPDERYVDADAMAKDLRKYLASDSRPMNETTLSAYMRKLFRDDYIRETGHIREYLAIATPVPAQPAERVSRQEPTTKVEGLPGVGVALAPAPVPMRDFVATRELAPAELEAVLALAAGVADLVPAAAETTVRHGDLGGDPFTDLTPADGLSDGAAETAVSTARDAELPDFATVVDDGAYEYQDLGTERHPLKAGVEPTLEDARTIEIELAPFHDTATEPAGSDMPELRRSLTKLEALVLALAIVLGLGVVAATYWYVSSPSASSDAPSEP